MDTGDGEDDENVRVDGDGYGYDGNDSDGDGDDSNGDGDHGEVESEESGSTKESQPSEHRRRLEEAPVMSRHFENRKHNSHSETLYTVQKNWGDS